MSTHTTKTAATLALETDLTASQVGHLRTKIKELIDGGAPGLVVDLARCMAIDSSGIGLLVATHNSLKKTGGKLTIAGASRELRELFQTMRLQQHFTILD